MRSFGKNILFLSLFSIAGILTFSQENYSTKNKKAIKLFEEAKQHYNLRDTEKAKQALLEAIEKDTLFVEAHTMLGYVYGDLNQIEKAIEEIKKALEINPTLLPGNHYTLAQFQSGAGNYKDAKLNFDRFLKLSAGNSEMKKAAEMGIVNCDFAIYAIEHPVPFSPVNAGEGLNSKYDEYFPSITADEQMFLFTRRLPADNTQMGFQEDFYVSNRGADGKWGSAYGIGPKINSPSNEGAPCLSPDGEILFFVACEGDFGYGAGRQGFGSCDIFYSYKNGNDWTKPQNLGAPVCTKWWETQPSFSSDGKTLYFVRGSMNAQGKKETDICMTTLKPGGKWTAPVKLGKNINTSGSEESVFIHPDNQTLYFSSDGHPGMGGLDIFMSRRQPNGEWGQAINLGYPINTFSDENSLLVTRDGKIAYFASDRKGGMGGLDIYSFDLYEAVQPGKTIYVKGKVFDAITKVPLESDIDVVDLQTSNSILKAVSNKKGDFLICLPINKNYAFNASKTGYLFYSENYSLVEKKDYQPIVVSIPLSPITNDIPVVLRNVFFDTNKFNLKDESKSELNKLLEFLTKNPTLKIELSGHTDNVGDKKSNQVLSENRAKSVSEYLSTNGIIKERLIYKGYGDTKPVVENDSDEHRQMNRRTEFKVVIK
ncbi:MAG: tetratricopeptide repeat protein [Bacteroidetes bacterium]|nr:MAG: tetratricopeptide repeat protein [Bacteroidota bacterium]